MSKTYDLRHGFLFPFQFLILGYVLIIAGVIIFIEVIWLSLILCFLGLLIVTAYSGVQFKEGKYKEYNSFLFRKTGAWYPLGKVDKLFIKEYKKSQKMYGRANQSSIISKPCFSAYLQLESGKKIFLGEQKDRIKLEKKTNELKQFLNF